MILEKHGTIEPRVRTPLPGAEATTRSGESLPEDLLNVQVGGAHLLDNLDPLERQVISAHYGLTGPPRSMKELHSDLGLPRDELRGVLGSGLAKLRARLNG